MPLHVHHSAVIRCSTGAPGCINSTFLNGMSFVEGWEQRLYISKWSMHQLVQIIFCFFLVCGFVFWVHLLVQHLLWKLLGVTLPFPFSISLLFMTFSLLDTKIWGSRGQSTCALLNNVKVCFLDCLGNLSLPFCAGNRQECGID